MLRNIVCPRCKRGLGVHFDEGEPLLASCPRCGTRAEFEGTVGELAFQSVTDDMFPEDEPDLDDPKHETSHSALTYRQRCGQRRTHGG